MRNYLALGLLVFLVGCGPHTFSVKETAHGYEIMEYTRLEVVLQTPLSSRLNERGDNFVARLKVPLLYRGKTVLPEGTRVRGLVKRAGRLEGSGNRAGLLLLFDQIVLPGGRTLPMLASLDTAEGDKVIKIKGRETRNARVISSAGISGSLLGKASGQSAGAAKGLMMGVVAGTGAVLLTDEKELKLPAGTELRIRLDVRLTVPKQ